jgi:hypothetical protein
LQCLTPIGQLGFGFVHYLSVEKLGTVLA